MPDLLTGEPSPMDGKLRRGAELQRREVAANAPRFTQDDLNKAAVAAWNDAIELVLIHVQRHNGKGMAEAIERTVNEYQLRRKP